MAYSAEKPFLPSVARGEARATSIARGLLAYARAGDLEQAQAEVKDDRGAVALLTRTAVSPYSPANLTAFSESVVDTTIDILGPANAASAILSRAGVKANFDRQAAVWVPGANADGSHVGFVAPANPLRVVQFDESKGVSLAAGMKLGFSIVLTNELLAHSNAVPFLRAKMTEDLNKGVDGLLLDANPAVAGLRPAGLLNAAQTVAAVSTSTGVDAMIADIGALAAAVGGIGGEILYIANIAEVTRINARLPFLKNVYPSSAVTAGNLIAIAPRGIAVAGSDTGPRIDTASETALAMDDALIAQQISAVGSPNTVMAPVISLFQSNCTALRLLLPDLVWGQRVPAGAAGCVAVLTGTIKW